MNIQRLLCTYLLVLACIPTQTVLACPRVGAQNNVDFNCDQRHRGTFTGDSIVKGVGDELNNNVGGYVKRIKGEFTDSRFFNLGVPGITTDRLLADFKQNVVGGLRAKTIRATRNIDFIVIDVGRNDFFQDRPASITVRNIRRLVKFLRRTLGDSSSRPLIVVSTLLPTNRDFQAPFIEEVNDLLRRQKGANLPVFLDFNRLPKRFLSADGLHPSSEGYDRMTNILSKYLRNRLQRKSLENRPDLDEDGIFDRFEASKFGTDPELADTDGDSIDDGTEVFDLETDPTNPLDPGMVTLNN